MKAAPRRSWVTLRLVQAGALLSLLVMAGSLSSRTPTDEAGFFRDQIRKWCTAHPNKADLQFVSIDVTFHPEPPLFAPGEGLVVAPVALDMPGAQRVLDVASHPDHLRQLTAGGVTTLGWEYGGRLHRGMRFRALALVERPWLRQVDMPAAPSFTSLPPDLKPESLARAKELEEHDLHKCAAFPEWAARAAGPPPHTAQVERLVKAVSARLEGKPRPEDLCAALRDGRFQPHWAQVAVVMGARQLDIPAFGFASAYDSFLVGTYVDGPGWVLMNVERPEAGWFTGGPALVTMAPLLAGFSASQHGFWYAQAAAYADSGWGMQTLSATEWLGGGAEPGHRTDTTQAMAMPLENACR